jgi:uncharacterized protein (DUF58 family)
MQINFSFTDKRKHVGDNPSRKINIESEQQLNTWLLPLLVGVFAVLYALTGFRGWFIFFIGSAGVLLLALLWVFLLRQNLHIERKLHLAWATVGDSVHEELKLINNSRLPAIWVEVMDTSEGLSMPVRMVSDVGAKTSRTRHLSHLCKKRGLYTLGPTRLRTGDPFGIFTLTMHDNHSDTILVTPPLLPLTQIRIAPAGWAGDQRRRRGALEREISDAGLRNYFPGDSLRRIHWHASAHFDQLIVRQLEASSSGDWWIYVDLEARVQAGKGQGSTLELSIVLAASLAMRGLREHRLVGLALAGPDLVWLEPRSDPAHRWRILRSLAVAGTGEYSLADLLRVRHPAQRATMIAITPSSDPSWIAAAGRRSGGGKVALLVDPSEFGRPIDQGRITSALASSRIPFHHIPRSLLEEAYPSIAKGFRKPSDVTQSRKRYLKHGRAAWQRMD